MNDTMPPVTTLTTPSDREIVITRTFDAPQDLVFAAWTTPEYVRRWYGTLSVCEIDLRPGGTWRYVITEPGGAEHPFTGTYREVSPTERLVYTEAYDVDGLRDHPALVTLTLEEQDGRTTMTSVSLYESPEYRDGHLASGMESGMVAALDRLAALVTTLRDATPATTTNA